MLPSAAINTANPCRFDSVGPWDPGPPKVSGDGNRSAAKRPAAVSARRDLELVAFHSAWLKGGEIPQ